jgi:hypothetical protein
MAYELFMRFTLDRYSPNDPFAELCSSWRSAMHMISRWGITIAMKVQFRRWSLRYRDAETQ